MNLSGPHSGYHWRRQTSRFFEGWYFRLTLPSVSVLSDSQSLLSGDESAGETFAFMYSIDDPAGGQDHSGGAAQILGPGETYYCRSLPDVTKFWAWPHRLGLGHWRTALEAEPARYLAPEDFFSTVKEGYQVSAHRHQGQLLGADQKTVMAKWDYHTQPISGWGAPVQRATAGWLSYLPVFEPGWQVLMAHGVSSGWIEWRGDRTRRTDALVRTTFESAPTYAEKNWGGAFPAKWFWIQCNAFADEPTLSITAVGGIREVLTWTENIGLIGIHYQGQLYEFISTKTAFTWKVEPWGYWRLTACSHQYRVEVIGQARDEGAYVRVPTQTGLQFLCRDTTHGDLQLRLWKRSIKESKPGIETKILDTSSQLAGLEVGGAPWDDCWIQPPPQQ
ncbi:MAG: tocopherol cyclase family protein [Cyanobacteria bacterium J06634_5]